MLSDQESNSDQSDKIFKRPVGFNMNEQQLEAFKKKWGIEPILRPSLPFHPHPNLAYTRNTLEYRAFALARETARNRGMKFCDVGSAPSRLRKFSEGHAMVPNLHTNDVLRRSQVAKNQSYCEHPLQQCTCGPFSQLVFVMSAWYFTTEELVNAIEKTATQSAYVVGHSFPEAFGGFEKEADYHYDDDGNIHMRVVGNHEEYVHKPLPWDHGQQVRLGDVCLDVSLMETMGATHLWLITLADGSNRPKLNYKPRALDAVLTDANHVGTIQLPAYDRNVVPQMTTNAPVHFEFTALYKLGPVLLASTTHGKCVVPTGAVQYVARKLLMRERTPAVMRDAVHYARQALEGARLPPDVALRATTVAAVLGFNYNVYTEMEMVNHAVSRFGWLWGHHSQALQFRSPMFFWATNVVALAGAVLPAVCFYIANRQMVFTPFAVTTVGLTTTVRPFTGAIRRYVGWWIFGFAGDAWYDVIRSGHAAHVDGEHHPEGKFTARALIKPAAPLGPDDEISFENVRDPAHPAEEKETLLHTGIAGSTAVPTVVVADQEAEHSAITHRVLRSDYVAPDVSSPAYQAYVWEVEAGPAFKDIRRVRIDNSEAAFESWVSQKKFNETFRKLMRETHDKCKDSYPPKQVGAKPFIKVEKGKVTNMEGTLPTKPRLIQAPPDGVKSETGPAISQLYSRMVKIWGGPRVGVLYASGRSSDAIGKIVDEFIDDCGGDENVAMIVNDFETFDATARDALQTPFHALYRRVGFTEHTLAWLWSVETKGRTPHGVVYKAGPPPEQTDPRKRKRKTPFEILSGQMDTNLLGTAINATALLSGFRRYCKEKKIGMPKLLLLVCGDDGSPMLPKAFLSEHDDFLPYLEQHLRDLGLRPGLSVAWTRESWEICSKLFWLGIDRQTGATQTVLGPKLGRIISRTGWTANVQGILNQAGVVKGLMVDAGHIPFIREYVEASNRLLTNHKVSGKEWEGLHASKAFDPHPDNYRLIYERYGLTSKHLEEFVVELGRIQKMPCVIDIPWLSSAEVRDR